MPPTALPADSTPANVSGSAQTAALGLPLDQFRQLVSRMYALREACRRVVQHSEDLGTLLGAMGTTGAPLQQEGGYPAGLILSASSRDGDWHVVSGWGSTQVAAATPCTPEQQRCCVATLGSGAMQRAQAPALWFPAATADLQTTLWPLADNSASLASRPAVIIVLASQEPTAFNPEECLHLHEVMQLINDAISRKHLDEQRHALLSRQQIYHRAIEASSDGVMITDAENPEHPVVQVNPAFTAMTGYGAAEIVGKNARFLVGDDLDQPGLSIIRDCLQQHKEGEATIRCYRQDHSLLWVNLTVAPVPDDSGRVRHFISVFTNVSREIEQHGMLVHYATHDALTGLANQALLNEQLDQALAMSRRSGKRVLVASIDIDRFSNINERYGRGVGDLVIVQVAERLTQALRDSDTVARISSDEFAIILTQLGESSDPGLLIEGIFNRVCAPYSHNGEAIDISISLGYVLSPEHGTQPEQLLRNAGSARRAAKRQGRGAILAFSSEYHDRLQEKMQLETALHGALARNEFHLLFQPKVDLRSGQITGCEALIRWEHPELGLIPPVRFIPVAEATGAISAIGTWVLQQACHNAHAWWRDFGREISVAVNVAAVQFCEVGFAETVQQVLCSSGLPPRLLELELTESMVMENPAEAEVILAQLRALGISLALDDFGTGYSSLSYLRRFPFDTIKIDRSFILEITSNPDDAAIANAVIAMGRSLRLKVVAEGVETEGQLRYLQNKRCDEIQGYLFSRPVTNEVFRNLLAQGECLRQELPENNKGTQTLLLVDDEPSIINALRRLLRSEGYQILSATSGAEALELLSTHPVQVILSDQRMPGMNGSELFSRVKDLYPTTIRIILSGYADADAITESINRGAIYRFLTKPWDDSVLRKEIRNAFARHEEARQHPAS